MGAVSVRVHTCARAHGQHSSGQPASPPVCTWPLKRTEERAGHFLQCSSRKANNPMKIGQRIRIDISPKKTRKRPTSTWKTLRITSRHGNANQNHREPARRARWGGSRERRDRGTWPQNLPTRLGWVTRCGHCRADGRVLSMLSRSETRPRLGHAPATPLLGVHLGEVRARVSQLVREHAQQPKGGSTPRVHSRRRGQRRCDASGRGTARYSTMDPKNTAP